MLTTKSFLINKHNPLPYGEGLNNNPELAVKELWINFFNFLLESGLDLIFVHNLGSFDGYFICSLRGQRFITIFYGGGINYN